MQFYAYSVYNKQYIMLNNRTTLYEKSRLLKLIRVTSFCIG